MLASLLSTFLILFSNTASSDPCGMVPPIAINDINRDDAISRIGIQRTYVMYKDGMETMVLHPQFK